MTREEARKHLFRDWPDDSFEYAYAEWRIDEIPFPLPPELPFGTRFKGPFFDGEPESSPTALVWNSKVRGYFYGEVDHVVGEAPCVHPIAIDWSSVRKRGLVK